MHSIHFGWLVGFSYNVFKWAHEFVGTCDAICICSKSFTCVGVLSLSQVQNLCVWLVAENYDVFKLVWLILRQELFLMCFHFSWCWNLYQRLWQYDLYESKGFWQIGTWWQELHPTWATMLLRHYSDGAKTRTSNLLSLLRYYTWFRHCLCCIGSQHQWTLDKHVPAPAPSTFCTGTKVA